MAHVDGDLGHNLAHDKLEKLGTLGYAQVVANQTAVVDADLTGLTVTVTVGAGRRIRVSAFGNIAKDTSAGFAEFRIMEGATVLTLAYHPGAISTSVGLSPSVILTPTTGSHTYKLHLTFSVTGGDFQASATKPGYVLVEDIGV